MSTVTYPAKFSTLDGHIYVGWWEGKTFKSEVFKKSQKADADKLYKKLRES